MPAGEEQQVDDGWTRVGKGKGKPPAYVHGLNPPMRDMSEAKIQADFDRKMQQWRASGCRKQVLQILDRQKPDEGWQIGNALCLASGSFSRDNWQSRQRSLAQFVAFVDVVRHLQSAQSAKILCYAQEPDYTPLDKGFLDTIGVMALDHELALHNSGLGAAAQHLDTTSFVFEPFMDMGVDTMADLFGADVRLYIGSSVQRWVDDAKKADLQIRAGIRRWSKVKDDEISTEEVEQAKTRSRQATTFVQSRRSYRFPTFEDDPNVFEGLSIYWQEQEDDE